MVAIGLALPVAAEPLSFDEVVEKAIDASYDLQMGEIDVAISNSDVKSARPEYYPTLRGRVSTEYLKDLEDTGFRPVTTVGDTVIPAATRPNVLSGALVATVPGRAFKSNPW